MKNFGVRFKFVLFISLLITAISAANSWYFFTRAKSQLDQELVRCGYSYIAQLTQDGEVKDALRVAQKAFFDEPIKRLRNLDRERVLAYWRVLLVPDNILLEEKELSIKTEIGHIPMSYNFEDTNETIFNVLFTDSGEQFFDFVAPVYEKHAISEEEFAAQIFSLDEGYDERERELLGVVQIGLTPERINKKMQTVLWASSVPLGFIIVLVGIGVSYFIVRSVVKPVENLVKVTEKVASGDLEQMVKISSRDEIGMLASRFNKMTKSLKLLMGEKENVMVKLRGLNKELSSANAELAQANEELKDAQERLIRTEKLAAVGTLASGVSHELRNPLSAIKNAVFFLKRKLSDKESVAIDARIIQFLDIMDKEIDRSNKIISDLLGFARVTRPTKIPCDITIVINEALSRVKMAGNIRLSKNFQSDLPMVMMDANQIGQVFVNMIENACQAMTDGGELQISTRESKGFAETEVADSGCGIPEKTIKKIFDPLFTTKPEGVGMGLAVCHGIIQKHEGIIDVKSQVGKGTNIFIKLPLEEKNGKAR